MRDWVSDKPVSRAVYSREKKKKKLAPSFFPSCFLAMLSTVLHASHGEEGRRGGVRTLNSQMKGGQKFDSSPQTFSFLAPQTSAPRKTGCF